MSDLNSIPSLNEDELETLGVLLEDEADRQDSFDFFAVHGLMTALIAGPVEFSVQQIWDCAFDEQQGFSKAEKEQVNTLLLKLAKEIQAWLDSGQDFPVPADLTLVDDEEEPPLESWAMGFMTGVLLQEEQWYAREEETVAQHLFPIMYASGLFMDEDEMADIDEDIDLSNQMCSNIPAAVVELYLLLHAED
ncbi:MAG: YecA family protein [Saccharospirillaceae bacterium]|nr:YecA family protein [Saccharospirillaceae bacterium]MCD8532579.1 YecA family protein [Saccharospirillaceae bacterium]